jgi:hypothetical protein
LHGPPSTPVLCLACLFTFPIPNISIPTCITLGHFLYPRPTWSATCPRHLLSSQLQLLPPPTL